MCTCINGNFPHGGRLELRAFPFRVLSLLALVSDFDDLTGMVSVISFRLMATFRMHGIREDDVIKKFRPDNLRKL